MTKYKIDKLQNLGAQPGDVVRCVTREPSIGWAFHEGLEQPINDIGGKLFWHGIGQGLWPELLGGFQIVRRADPSDVEYENTRPLKKGETRRTLSPGDELWRKARAVGPFSPDHDYWSGWTIGGDEEDARFIATSRNLWPEMIAEIERLRAELDARKHHAASRLERAMALLRTIAEDRPNE